MKKVITYGTYDLLHQGHINLLRRAKELGDYLIVGVTNDNFDRERGKLNVCNNVLERVEAVKATGLADQIIIEDYFGQKIDDIQKYDVDIFAIGSDWEGKFDYLNEYCKVVQKDMHISLLHGGRPTISNYATKTPTRTRSSSTNGMARAYVMKFRSGCRA